MHNLPLATLLLAALLGLSQCKKKDPDPVDQLPPATQTGANTVGCLLNGQAWVPFGKDHFSVYYDPGYRYGTINISLTKPSKTSSVIETVAIFSDSLRKVGKYALTFPKHQEATYSIGYGNPCSFFAGDPHYRAGELIITQLDLKAGIIAGTFEFTLAKPGCDTLKFTQGRFDKKL
ncbi:DUF6252 family protein [Hymenobacter rubidus]|uniref:DUF6252 family protein n=1 Tax=Hymenobacter rubidus TaxID=1441626 RepID=UPI00191DD116|nr:DUF6252 family protein [Hymenobacter rubidus]